MKNNRAETFRQLVEQEMQKPEELRSYRKIARWTKQWEKCAGVEKSLDAAAARGMGKLMSQKPTEPDAETETYTVEVQRHPQWTQIAAAAACLLVVGGTTVGVMRMKPNRIETMENVETETETTSTPETTQGVTETTAVTSEANVVKLQTTAVTETARIQTTVGVTETAVQSQTAIAELSTPETITESQLVELPEETVATVLAEPEDQVTLQETVQDWKDGFRMKQVQTENGTENLIVAVTDGTEPITMDLTYLPASLEETGYTRADLALSPARNSVYSGWEKLDETPHKKITCWQSTKDVFSLKQPEHIVKLFERTELGTGNAYIANTGIVQFLLWDHGDYIFYMEGIYTQEEELLEAARTLHAYE